MHAFSIPVLRYSLPAGGAVAVNRFVSVANSKAVQAGEDAVVIGVSQNAVEGNAGVPVSNQIVEIITGLVPVLAGGAISSGDLVTTNSEGKAVKGTEENAVGVAITGASAAGALLTVKL